MNRTTTNFTTILPRLGQLSNRFLPSFIAFRPSNTKCQVESFFHLFAGSIIRGVILLFHPDFIIRRKKGYIETNGKLLRESDFQKCFSRVRLIAIIAMVEVASGHFLKIAINPCPRKVLRTLRSLINLNESRAR